MVPLKTQEHSLRPSSPGTIKNTIIYGLGLITPEDVHYGRAAGIIKAREEALMDAYEKHPERFKRNIPKPMPVPQEVWINKPIIKNQEVLH